jgi:phosphate/sulfate permease
MLVFITVAAFLGLAMLIWDCVEVGRNDAANLVNAVFGARVMSRRVAVLIAGIAVILGATASSPVIETTRKEIFDPTVLSIKMALAIYISVYFVDTVLLYTFSGFGMPVSTTACLVFELVGASLFLAGPDNVAWPVVGKVTGAIILSIIISALAAFMVMRVFRGAIQQKSVDRDTVLLHGPWISGAMFTWLTWFIVFKGLKNVPAVKQIKETVFEVHGEWLVLLVAWGVFTLIVHLVLVMTHRAGYKYLFPTTAVVGMICMAFAFGQNDLANAASPGLSAFTIRQEVEKQRADGVEVSLSDKANLASKVPISKWALFGCGLLMASGMFTTYAQRVTRAEVNTGSQFDEVALYAPRWCRSLARLFLKMRPPKEALAPEAGLSETGKKIHYDTLRASVITGVSASVIAFASGRGLPVSTTYVAFAAVLGTGLADRVFSRGDADRKIGRAIWVITCWFIAPVIAIVATGCVARIAYHLSVVGLMICLGLNFTVRFYFKRRADAHEKRHHKSTEEESGDAPSETVES